MPLPHPHVFRSPPLLTCSSPLPSGGTPLPAPFGGDVQAHLPLPLQLRQAWHGRTLLRSGTCVFGENRKNNRNTPAYVHTCHHTCRTHAWDGQERALSGRKRLILIPMYSAENVQAVVQHKPFSRLDNEPSVGQVTSEAEKCLVRREKDAIKRLGHIDHRPSFAWPFLPPLRFSASRSNIAKLPPPLSPAFLFYAASPPGHERGHRA